jgi:thioredoxin 1
MIKKPDAPLPELTMRNFFSILAQEGIVLVNCWASSCASCKAVARIYAKVAEQHPQHAFVKLDTVAEEELASSLGVADVPTLLLYRDGIRLLKQPGNFDEARLEDIIAQAEAVDVDAFRADMERKQVESQPPPLDGARITTWPVTPTIDFYGRSPALTSPVNERGAYGVSRRLANARCCYLTREAHSVIEMRLPKFVMREAHGETRSGDANTQCK